MNTKYNDFITTPKGKLINRIRLDESIAKNFKNQDNQIWDLGNLKQVNVFLGANNSGKSRLLRSIFQHSNFSSLDSDFLPFDKIGDIIAERLTYSLGGVPGISQINTVQSHFAQLSRECVNSREMKDYSFYASQLPQLADLAVTKVFGTRNKQFKQVFRTQALQVLIDCKAQDISVALNSTYKSFTYIPVLRGLRPVVNTDIESDIDTYKERTLKDYFQNGNTIAPDHIIFTGASIYRDLKKALLGSHQERAKVRKFEKFLSTYFFRNQELTLTPRIDEDVVYFKVGDKEERPIYLLGDGIQALIIITFPIFNADLPSMFFIEEAEQHLHASLQRILIDVMSQFPEHMYFVTSHSNHFIDIAQERDDVGIQRIWQEIDDENNEISFIQSQGDYSSLLADLGVRASSVLLANCSIWVEGITDKLYLRAFMQKYLKLIDKSDKERADKLRSYQENLHYVFMEYQGSNITHWDFSDSVEGNNTPAKKLSSNVFLIADHDIDGKSNRTVDLQAQLGDKFALLPFKEIENHLPLNVVVETAKARWETFNGTSGCELDRLENIQSRSVRAKNVGIGRTLEKAVTKTGGVERKFFEADSGTIKDKVKFCKKAVELMSSEELEWELIPEITELCDKIWTHIEQSN
ncbi:AAA family ATPase [Vibrio sp. HN007]|uniref:AAA family ATPase n=1 Tax=Vibrio iocasae TaxID=3098914 RepID=UPI0035D4ADB3